MKLWASPRHLHYGNLCCATALSSFSQPEGAWGGSSPFLASVAPAPFFCRSPLEPVMSQSRCIPVHGCLETGLWARLHAPFICPRLSRQLTFRC